MEQNRNSSESSRHWREDWDGQDSSIPEPPWVPDRFDRLLDPELDKLYPLVDPLPPAPAPPPPAVTAPEPPAYVPTPDDSGFYYKNGRPIPPTHPDHGPMHLLPRQEDGSFAAYYYCSREELDAACVDAPPPRRQRRDGFSAERQQLFVQYYRDTGSLTDAARLTGIARSTAYNLINSTDGAAFREAIAEAGRGIDTILEATAFERCIKGQEEIVYHKGQRVGVRWKFDNKLLMALLRARQPLKYAPLSELETWMKRRGPEAPADLDGALDRLAAAEAQWGRRLAGEPCPQARQPAPARIAGAEPAIASNESNLPGAPEEAGDPEAASNASNSSNLPGAAGQSGNPEAAPNASNSSSLPGAAEEAAEAEPPANASNSSNLPSAAGQSGDPEAASNASNSSNSSNLPDAAGPAADPDATANAPGASASAAAAPEVDPSLVFYRPPARPRLRPEPPSGDSP